MFIRNLLRNLAILTVLVGFTTSVMAHQMTIKGTVVAVEASCTGPEIDGIAPFGRISPNTLFRVARLNCSSRSVFGR